MYINIGTGAKMHCDIEPDLQSEQDTLAVGLGGAGTDVKLQLSTAHLSSTDRSIAREIWSCVIF